MRRSRRSITGPQDGQDHWPVRVGVSPYTVVLPATAYLPPGWNRDMSVLKTPVGPVNSTELVTIGFTDDTADTLGLVVSSYPDGSGPEGSLLTALSGPKPAGHVRLAYDDQLGRLYRLTAQCARVGRQVSFANPIWESHWHPLIRLAAERDATFDPGIRRELQDAIDATAAGLVIEARRAGVMSANRQIQDWLETPEHVGMSYEQFAERTAAWERANREQFSTSSRAIAAPEDSSRTDATTAAGTTDAP